MTTFWILFVAISVLTLWFLVLVCSHCIDASRENHDDREKDWE